MQHSNHPEGKLFLGFLFALFCGSLFGFVFIIFAIMHKPADKQENVKEEQNG